MREFYIKVPAMEKLECSCQLGSMNHQLIQLAKYLDETVLVIHIKPLNSEMRISIFYESHGHVGNHLQTFNPVSECIHHAAEVKKFTTSTEHQTVWQ